MRGQKLGILLAVLAAALYALNAPLSKMLLAACPATMMAALLYLGAGLGMTPVALATRRRTRSAPFSRRDLPYLAAMVALDSAAPILLMAGLARTEAANIALLNNFEIVATTLIAALLFRESVSRRLALGVGLVTLSSLLLSLGEAGSLRFSAGSMLALGACLCWGLENNCTRRLSDKNPMVIVVIKGFGSGLASLVIALAVGEALPSPAVLLRALPLGFVAYGLSICCYIYAQRFLGAAKTSAYYALAPFIGAMLSLILLREAPGARFWAALMIMAWGAWVVTKDALTPEAAG